MSIFWPKNPVHDGAVIIRGNHVAEVGVLLPFPSARTYPPFMERDIELLQVWRSVPMLSWLWYLKNVVV